VDAIANPQDRGMSATLLRIDDVSRRFGGLLAVDSVAVDVAEGEIVSIIGPNGAGKTTLFNLLTGQLAPTSGRIMFEGQDISRLPPQKRARLGFGRTFQISQTLTSLTVLENAMVGAFLRRPRLTDAARHARTVLDMVGLGARATEKAGALTLNERRRLEVARALATEPPILLLDEVMAGLNPTEVHQVVELVQTLNGRGYTFLVIEHNLKVVRTFSKHVVVLNRGAKLAEGTADDVLANPVVVEAYVGRKRT
jgi:branched-chain amino acid transport system ATP-binding protein